MAVEIVVPEDGQTEPTDAEIDEAYNELIGRILGQEAVDADKPLRDSLGDSDPGGVTVVPDAFDLGLVVPVERAQEDQAVTVARVMKAVRRSYRAIPLDPSE